MIKYADALTNKNIKYSVGIGIGIVPHKLTQ